MRKIACYHVVDLQHAVGTGEVVAIAPLSAGAEETGGVTPASLLVTLCLPLQLISCYQMSSIVLFL
jgi:hypothetical protein